MKSTIGILATLILASAISAFAQAVPFLNYPVSAPALGMGGVGTAFISDNATATIANPAQLGIFSLNGMLNASTDLHNSLGPPYYGSSASFYATAANAGFILNRLWAGLPIQVGVGVGYSHLLYNSEFILSGASWPGQMTGASNGLSFGVGLGYYLRIGIGYTLKWTKSSPSSFPGTELAQDFGTIFQIPITHLLSDSGNQLILIGKDAQPIFNLSVGYAMRNVGGYAPYNNPLPREADLGWNINVGLKSTVARHSWEWLSLSWSNEANNAPLKTDSTIGTINGEIDTVWVYYQAYRKGLGNFNPWRNLILGKASASVGVRKGGQIGLGEFIYIRAGSITDAGQTTYTTFGWGLRLDGLAKCLVFFKWLGPKSPVAKFLLDHLDLQYDYSRAYGRIYGGKPFEDLNLVVR